MRRPRGLNEAESFHWFMPGDPPATGCWDWTGSILNGYGQFSMTTDGKLRNVKAHRASYQIYHGPIPEGLGVLHSCDRPICVHPAHLEAGSHLINMQDASARGLLPRGENRWNAKLTQEDVAFIRSSTLQQKILAQQFGVSQSHISRIRTGSRPVWVRV